MIQLIRFEVRLVGFEVKVIRFESEFICLMNEFNKVRFTSQDKSTYNNSKFIIRYNLFIKSDSHSDILLAKCEILI